MTTSTDSLAAPIGPSVPVRRKSAPQTRGLYSHLVLLPLALVCLFPLYWMVVTALRPEGDVFSTALWPQAPSLENFAYVLKAVPLGTMLLTTTYMAAITTLLQAVTGLMAAYVFARSQARAGKWMLALLTVTWLIPPQVIMIPNFVLVNRMGLLDTLGGLILPHAASAFAIMLLYQAMRSFPREVIESAEMDGCGHVRILFSIIVPNLRPVIASISILLFISAWNEYLWPLLVTRSADQTVVQIGLQMFMTEQGNQWAALMAAATLASLPILAIYLALQRQIIDTFVRSGLR